MRYDRMQYYNICMCFPRRTRAYWQHAQRHRRMHERTASRADNDNGHGMAAGIRVLTACSDVSAVQAKNVNVRCAATRALNQPEMVALCRPPPPPPEMKQHRHGSNSSSGGGGSSAAISGARATPECRRSLAEGKRGGGGGGIARVLGVLIN